MELLRWAAELQGGPLARRGRGSCTKVEATVIPCHLDLLGLGPERCRLGDFDKSLGPLICKTELAAASTSYSGYQD